MGETEDPNLSRMTFVVVGDDRDPGAGPSSSTVVRVVDVSSRNYVERDLMLLKAKAPPGGQRRDPRAGRDLPRQDRGRRCRGADDRDFGRKNKIEAPGVAELVRSGRIAMVRSGVIYDEQ